MKRREYFVESRIVFHLNSYVDVQILRSRTSKIWRLSGRGNLQLKEEMIRFMPLMQG